MSEVPARFTVALLVIEVENGTAVGTRHLERVDRLGVRLGAVLHGLVTGPLLDGGDGGRGVLLRGEVSLGIGPRCG